MPASSKKKIALLVLNLVVCACVSQLVSVAAINDSELGHGEAETVDQAKLPQVIDFNRDIRPILTAHCTSCHGGVRQAGGISFIYEDLALDCVESGDPDNSYLIERVEDEDDESRMPPAKHGPRLSSHDVALLRLWIEQGAKWGKHWAYELPKSPTAPEVSDQEWAQQPIDRFVLKQLDDHKVTPAPDESPERWLRRVSLDLIGLPPTLKQRDDFLANLKRDSNKHNAGDAYEKVVDRLLDSKHFGERWGSVWFDQVRYADSRGQGEDSPREIWKYRDWVIKALNDDMPYDQFTIKQLAGDLLSNPTIEDHMATAVHRLTHTNEEGGTDDEEFRIAAVLDRVNTTWQTWQGTTFGCTQCHDHPYDPFAHDEYYKFAAYFNNTADCDLSDDWPNIEVPIAHEDYDRASALDKEIKRLRNLIWEQNWSAVSAESLWTPLKISKAKASNKVKLAIEPQETHDQFHTVGTISSGTSIQIDMPVPKSMNQITAVRVTGMPLDPQKALADSEWGFVMSHIKGKITSPKRGDKKAKDRKIEFKKVYADDPFPRHDPNESLKEKSKFGFSAYTRIHRARHAVLVLKKPISIARGDVLKLSINHRVTELAAFPLLTRRGQFAVCDDESLIQQSDGESIVALEKQLKELTDQRAKIKSTQLPVLVERAQHLSRPSHVFIRGLFLTKDKQVRPDVPNSLFPNQPSLENRLELARWMVSDDNPLTARVAVNRFWARMFGVGLVATEEDFGSTGEPPSHPELLDDLAIRFRDQYQWSVKKLLRELALSRTYRQSSKIRPEILEQDSNNRWLARGPRHSLPAETVRDQILAISGLLSDKMFGKPVYPPLPPGVWKARRGKWKTPKPGSEDRYRRSVYTYIKRSVPFPMNAIFDAPSRDFCQPKRLRSNTPLQPLMLLNDSTAVESAAAFAKKMLDHHEDPEQQIAFGIELATCRKPFPDELERMETMYEAISTEADEKVALQSVAAVILNLDEIITK